MGGRRRVVVDGDGGGGGGGVLLPGGTPVETVEAVVWPGPATVRAATRMV